MSSDRRALERLGAQARQAREAGDYPHAAQLERQAADLAKALGLAGERSRALLWQGYSLWLSGQDDLALATLLRVAGESAASIDPADVFAALTAIIRISLDRKTAGFCRALLEQARRYLADIRRPWTAPLDFLDGELAYRQGDFAAAWEWHGRAWAGWRDQHPRLTSATHLWALCRTAFRRRDAAALTRWAATLADLHPTPRLEQQMAQRARLLSWRAQRAADPALKASTHTPDETALALLAATANDETRDSDARREALRALALAGRWVTLDGALSQHPPQPERFEQVLLLGDLALNRARAARAAPTVDDEYGEDAGDVPLLNRICPETRPWLDEAAGQYQSALTLAEAEDERLETDWHVAVVQKRRGRVLAFAEPARNSQDA